MAAKWDKKTLKLREGHHWEARPGYSVFVADRGAVRFDVPNDWILKPDPDSFKFHDAEPPDDDCVLAFSYNRLPPYDWSRAPLKQFLKQTIALDDRGLQTSGGKISEINRQGMRLVWSEHSFTDPVENRKAYSRILIALRGTIQCLITMDYWPEDGPRVRPVWDEVLRTLRLGERIPDPTTGSIIVPRLN